MSDDKISKIVDLINALQKIPLNNTNKLDSGINHEIKDIERVIRSLENREIFMKGTTRKITIQEVGFPNFLKPLMTADLPLMKGVLTPLVKSVLESWQQRQQ